MGCRESDGHSCGGSCFVAHIIKDSGTEAFLALKANLISEINALGFAGLQVTDLNLLNGAWVNLAYPLPNGSTAQFLDDRQIYLGNQIEGAGNGRCYGVVANESMLLVCTYGDSGSDPELLLYKRI